MALNFAITFNEDLSFDFDDLSELADYTGLGSVAKTDLKVTYPSISGNTAITLNLYDENIAALTDDYTFVVANEDDLTTLVDGVYKFELVALDSGGTELGSKVKYYVQDATVQQCLRTLIDGAIDDQCSDDWCKIGFINASVQVAILRAANDYYTEAQEKMDYLKNHVCNGC